MENNVSIVDRSYKFALEIIKVVNLLPKNTSGSVIGNQIMKSGTSIGANAEEAQRAASKKDFANKMTISKKRSERNKVLA